MHRLRWGTNTGFSSDGKRASSSTGFNVSARWARTPTSKIKMFVKQIKRKTICVQWNVQIAKLLLLKIHNLREELSIAIHHF